MKQTHIPSSVQRDLLSVRETSGDMLCLYAPGSPTRRSYRAVLEVAPINLSLKAEDEQEAIIGDCQVFCGRGQYLLTGECALKKPERTNLMRLSSC